MIFHPVASGQRKYAYAAFVTSENFVTIGKVCDRAHWLDNDVIIHVGVKDGEPYLFIYSDVQTVEGLILAHNN